MSAAGQAVLKAAYFVRRDFLEDISYRFAFFGQAVGMLLSAITFYFMGRVFGGAVAPYLQPYGGNYFSFALVGIAFAGFQSVALQGFASSVRSAQMLGTLEALLVTPTSIPSIVSSSVIYRLLYVVVRTAVFLLLGVVVFGLNLSHANYLGGLVVLFLTLTSFSSAGILAAAMIMVFKKGDPIDFIFGGASRVFSGVFFPVSVFPGWLQSIAWALPLTHSLEGVRRTLLTGAPLSAISGTLLYLAVFSLVTLPLSIMAFRYAVGHAKMHGTLIHY